MIKQEDDQREKRLEKAKVHPYRVMEKRKKRRRKRRRRNNWDPEVG